MADLDAKSYTVKGLECMWTTFIDCINLNVSCIINLVGGIPALDRSPPHYNIWWGSIWFSPLLFHNYFIAKSTGHSWGRIQDVWPIPFLFSRFGVQLIFNSQILRLNKAMYILKQWGNEWFTRFSRSVKDATFVPCKTYFSKSTQVLSLRSTSTMSFVRSRSKCYSTSLRATQLPV